MKFVNKVALITGASSGIGEATAIEFAKEGAKVSLTGRNAAKLDKTAQKCREAGLTEDDIFLVVGDLNKQEDCLNVVDSTIKHFGQIDILVNNAGYDVEKGFMQTTIDDVDAMLNIFVRSVFTITQRALPSIIKQKGAVVNVSSAASLMAHTHTLAYAIAKAAMDHYVKLLALEVADKGVRVNTLNPGVVVTPIFGDDSEKAKSVAQGFAEMLHPNKRPVAPEEMAKSITFLASEDAAMITGVQLPIDGGWTLAGPQVDKYDPFK